MRQFFSGLHNSALNIVFRSGSNSGLCEEPRSISVKYSDRGSGSEQIKDKHSSLEGVAFDTLQLTLKNCNNNDIMLSDQRGRV